MHNYMTISLPVLQNSDLFFSTMKDGKSINIITSITIVVVTCHNKPHVYINSQF